MIEKVYLSGIKGSTMNRSYEIPPQTIPSTGEMNGIERVYPRGKYRFEMC
jgi:hypothetical protein